VINNVYYDLSVCLSVFLSVGIGGDQCQTAKRMIEHFTHHLLDQLSYLKNSGETLALNLDSTHKLRSMSVGISETIYALLHTYVQMVLTQLGRIHSIAEQNSI